MFGLADVRKKYMPVEVGKYDPSVRPWFLASFFATK